MNHKITLFSNKIRHWWHKSKTEKVKDITIWGFVPMVLFGIWGIILTIYYGNSAQEIKDMSKILQKSDSTITTLIRVLGELHMQNIKNDTQTVILTNQLKLETAQWSALTEQLNIAHDLHKKEIEKEKANLKKDKDQFWETANELNLLEMEGLRLQKNDYGDTNAVIVRVRHLEKIITLLRAERYNSILISERNFARQWDWVIENIAEQIEQMKYRSTFLQTFPGILDADSKAMLAPQLMSCYALSMMLFSVLMSDLRELPIIKEKETPLFN